MKPNRKWIRSALAAVVLSATTLSLQAKDALGKVEKASKLIGTEVRNNAGQKIGKIDDFVVDLESGRVLYSVLSVGGFIGIGDRLVAVPTAALREQGSELRLDADKQKLTQAPPYSKDADRLAEMTSPGFVGEMYRYFGQTTWWQTANMADAGKFGNVQRAGDLNHKDVKNVSNQKIADVQDVMIDVPAGRVAYVILDTEHALGLNEKLLAVPPNALTPGAEGKYLVTDLDRSKLAGAPAFDKDNWPNLSDPSYAAKVYAFFGKQPYFETSGLRPTSERPNSQERIYHEPKTPEK